MQACVYTVCLHACVFVHVCLCVHTCVYLCACRWACRCVGMCLCVCVPLCLCAHQFGGVCACPYPLTVMLNHPAFGEEWGDPHLPGFLQHILAPGAPAKLTHTIPLSQVEAVIHPTFLAELLSSETQLDLQALAEKLEQEEGLSLAEVSLGREGTR